MEIPILPKKLSDSAELSPTSKIIEQGTFKDKWDKFLFK